MALEPGSLVAGYEILSPLGSGGMSEVYRARDTSLGREVAVKVLPKDFALEPDRLARFEREAQLLASLSHPNIAVIHGIERTRELLFLVLEWIPGETLGERIARGALRWEDARAIFLQIARALEAAHEKGIVHRDLKPGNVKITSEGTVKLLDFGLGKEIGIGSTSSLDDTATYIGPGTSPGVFIGTPAYMSPEQARAQEVSKGTDVWSFGVCLFEALTGKNPFARETFADTQSAILNDPPEWGALPKGTPRAVAALLRRCLQKKVRDRLHEIADVRIALEDSPRHLEEVETPSPTPWPLATLGLAVALLVVWFVGPQAPPEPARDTIVRRFQLDLPPTAPLSLDGEGALAVAPEGTRIVYTVRSSAGRQLFMRPLDQLDFVPVPGTLGGYAPFFSTTGNTLGFVADGKLKLLPFGGGATVLTESPSPRGGTWLERDGEGLIVFSPSSSSGLLSIPETGGAPTSLTSLDSDAGERDHRWPSALPDGRSILFTTWTDDRFDLSLTEMGSTERTIILENGSYARYLPSRHLVFMRDGALHAARFDLSSRELRSQPISVVEGVAYDEGTGAGFYEVSNDGTLFYAETPTAGSSATLLLLDARGRATPLGAPKESIQLPRFSPDGSSLLATVQMGEKTDLWSLDLDRGNLTRLTFEASNGAGLFSPDGQRIAFSSDRSGPFSIYWKPADGSGETERLTEATYPQFPTSFSPDGKLLLYTEIHPDTFLDVWVLTLADRSRRPLLSSPFEEAAAVFSPDGDYVAFTSNESGREQVYVRAFPGPEGRWQISMESGSEPVWARDGKKLYFRSGSSLMVSDISYEAQFSPGPPRPLFEAPYDSAGSMYANYDITPEGEDFVMIRSEQAQEARSLQVVVNWIVELNRRVP